VPIVGSVTQLWRYPFKSMGGEQLTRCEIGPRGVVGDRNWAVRDERAGEIRGAKKLPALLRCHARYLEEPTPGRIPAAEIALPDGGRLRSDASDAAARLSELVGRAVTVWPVQPESSTDHYRRGAPDNPDMVQELRSIFGRVGDEPLPDFSGLPPELFEFSSPLGTYFDAFPLHLLSTASLRALAARTPGARIDVRRFRPNLVVEPAETADWPIETVWCGKTLRFGGVQLKIEIPCPRCVMTTLPQDDLPKEPSVLRSIVRDMQQSLGVYASVRTPGSVRVGDAVTLE
jgi:uncharacterized protein YcbX